MLFQAEDNLQEECARLQQKRIELTRQVRHLEIRIEELEEDGRAPSASAPLPARRDRPSPDAPPDDLLEVIQAERQRNADLEHCLEEAESRAQGLEEAEEALAAAMKRISELEAAASGRGGAGEGPRAGEQDGGVAGRGGTEVSGGAEEVQELRQAVERLKKSRDKLLARVEGQMKEMEELEVSGKQRGDSEQPPTSLTSARKQRHLLQPSLFLPPSRWPEGPKASTPPRPCPSQSVRLMCNRRRR